MNIDLKYPTSWTEVSREQLMIISALMLKNLTREEFLFIMFCRLTGIHLLMRPELDEDTLSAVYHFKKGKKRFDLPVTAIQQACEELSFVLDTVGLPDSPLPGVNSKLYDKTFKQFYFADAYFGRYQETKGVKWLVLMCQSLTGKQPRLKSVDAMAISFWWIGLKDHYKKTYPNVFTEGDSSGKNPAETLQEILSCLNNDKPQDNKTILDSDVNAVLLALDNIYLKAKTHADS